MKTCGILVLVTIITLSTPTESAQYKSISRRESRYPTRQPQSLFPDQLKISRTRVYRSVNPADNYRWDEHDLSYGSVVPKEDPSIIGSPGKLLKYNMDAKKSTNAQDEKLKALMTNDIDDNEDEEGYGSNYGYNAEGLPKKRRRILTEKEKSTKYN